MLHQEKCCTRKSMEKGREKIINIIRNNPTVTQLELSNMLQISPKTIEK